ncbi:hypothetical protein [Comamonas sp.]|uniref:hypothetical protein n=1 Tax=Comamonas sp. TaxID=34028 RepID=UPI00289B0113|nr:hypothetical protein [Comamonas sp.]
MELIKNNSLSIRRVWMIFFCLMLMLVFILYTPGLKGGYLFDDEPNLFPMGIRGGVTTWEAFRAFVFQGHSGPLGRPISLASFLLNAQTWPVDPYAFKLTNICIHLLAGAMLCWATLNLLRFYGVPEQHARWAALLNMSFWMLHPLMVSTTLYIVQRMAQLSALFIFAGLGGYLHGRILLQKGGGTRTAYVWMSTSLIVATTLATLSKENGALLPLLAWVIGVCHPKSKNANHASDNPDWKWSLLFLWLPSFAVLGILGRSINFSPDAWPTRPFNQMERILTEGRIIWEYLYQLYIPRIEGKGLFQDGYLLSTSLINPITTLWSLLGIAALIGLPFWFRRKGPLGACAAIALLFFLAAHLMESTVIGLELYFEHRNYVAAAFLFLPVAMGLIVLAKKRSVVLAGSISFLIVLTLGWLTWQRSTLWSDTEFLQNYWAVNTPDSPRAKNRLSSFLFDEGRDDEAFGILEAAMVQFPNSSLISMQWLLQKVVRGQAHQEDFKRVQEGLSKQRLDAQTVGGIRAIVEFLVNSPDSSKERKSVLLILDEMDSIKSYRAVDAFNKISPYLRGLLLISEREPVKAMPFLKKAIFLYKDMDFALSIVNFMAGNGYAAEGLILLNETEKMLYTLPDNGIVMSKSAYEVEINQLGYRLQNVVKNNNGSNDNVAR